MLLCSSKNYALLIGWKRMHSHVTQAQSCNTNANYKKCAHAFKITSLSTFCDVFLCTLLTSNNMILLQFGVKTLLNFSVFEKFTRAYLHQIALEIMWLPILNRPKKGKISRIQRQNSYNFELWGTKSWQNEKLSWNLRIFFFFSIRQSWMFCFT